MTVIYGRRRIGKSTLITEFLKNKKNIFYTATKVGKNRNLVVICGVLWYHIHEQQVILRVI